MRHRARRTPFALITVCLARAALAAPTPPSDVHARYPGVNARLDQVERLLIGGQPNEATLRAMIADGVTTVVNLRTPEEMANRERVPFDEAAVLSELGVRSILVPIGNPATYPYRPEAVDAIRDALATTDGMVLLHCQSGWRTAWTYGAYTIREKGATVDEGMGMVEELIDQHGDQFDQLLGVHSKLELASDADGLESTYSAAAPRYAAVPATGLNTITIEHPEPVTEMAEEYQARHFHVGPLHISGQPSEAALRDLKAQGVTVVINLRTQEEMDDRDEVPFDEAALLAELGIDYVHIPLGGWTDPYTPVAVDAFARALAAHEGKALLHCTVAWRASLMWGAYLARHRGYDVNAALAESGFIVPSGSPFDGLLGRNVVRTMAADH